MKYWTDEETGVIYSEPDCVDEWLFHIWALGHDYDGYNDAENLKILIDELVSMSQHARDCLHNRKLFSEEKELMNQQVLREKLNRLLWRFSMENGGDTKPWDGHTYHYYIYKPFNSNDPWTAWRVDGKDLGVVYFSSEDIVRRAMVEIVNPFMEKHPEFVW